MAIKELADTNIFLEILLGQQKKEDCKAFLNQNSTLLAISDFSLHSIGVVLFRKKKYSLFSTFWNDIQYQINLISLPINKYIVLEKNSSKYGLDFDDSYQFSVAQEYGLKLATLDRDFETVQTGQIHFL